jgi:tetratricopeptide (TPR) repeat protein
VVFLDGLEESPEVLQQQGDKHLAGHRYEEAVTCYSQAIRRLQQLQPSQQHHIRQQSQDSQQLGQLLLSVLLNLSATHLQLQHPMQALLYAAAASALSCHSNSKAYYRAAVALDQLIDPINNSGTSKRSSTVEGSSSAIAPSLLMEVAFDLSGHTTPAAKAQMMAALTNSVKARGGSSSSSTRKHAANGTKKAADGGVWQPVCQLLAATATDLASCFGIASCSVSGISGSSQKTGDALGDAIAVVAATSPELEKEAGNAAFKQEDYATALQHYLKALAALQSSHGALPALLYSRAAAWLEQPSKHCQQQAFLDAWTSALLMPEQAAAFATAAAALLQLDNVTDALTVCELGLRLLPESDQLQQMQRRVKVAISAADAASRPNTSQHQDPAADTAAATSRDAGAPERAGSTSSSSSARGVGSTSTSTSSARGGGSSSSAGRTSKHKNRKTHRAASGHRSSGSAGSQTGMTERELHDFTHQGCVEVEQVAMFNQMVRMAGQMSARHRTGGRSRRAAAEELAQLITLDERVAKLHEEFSKAGR